ncbi:hypothetical protein CY35_12G066600 [Sphagnum magellanicum]|nr:hypothetical protein CY35_12G066600 [Sphagnum magellanicum]KAH9545813.1 hypothetical protein CY35_12G066600 [Sphagnum magellanicum]
MGGSKVISSTATAAAAHGAVVASCSWGVLVLLLLSAVGTVQCLHSSPTPPGLSEDFYAKSCPQVFDIVSAGVALAALTDIRDPASLLRVSFHDCWIGGCDASLLLDNSTTFESEKFAVPNNNSIRGFNVLDAIKETLETVCPQTVSCADIVTIAARDSVALVGGKGWPVVLGRRDSLTSHFDLANASDGTGLPSPFVSLDATFANFALRNFSQAETITLSGAHTFGRAHCITFTGRFNDTRPFNLTDTNVNPILKKEILEVCPPNDTTTVIDLDVTTPNIFDNAYYKNLGYELGVLHTDQNLVTTPGSNELVQLYSSQNDLFLTAFAEAMIKMQNLGPLTGTEGEIRIKCGEVNPPDSSSSSSSRTSSESSIAVE